MTTITNATQENLAEELFNLEQVRDEIQNALTQAQFERDEAKTKLKKTGEYSDPEWFAETTRIIRERTMELHDTNRRIKNIRRQMSKSNPKSSFFVQAARKLLDTESFKKINDLANEYMASGNS